MNKADFQVCYDLLDNVTERTEAQEKTYQKIKLILRQIDIQENAQEALTNIRNQLQELEQQ